jgi:hypothetical protein
MTRSAINLEAMKGVSRTRALRRTRHSITNDVHFGSFMGAGLFEAIEREHVSREIFRSWSYSRLFLSVVWSNEGHYVFRCSTNSPSNAFIQGLS